MNQLFRRKPATHDAAPEGEIHGGAALGRHLTLRDLTSRHPLRTDDVVDTLRECNRRILKAAAASPDTEGMGTTMAGVTIVRTGGADHWCVFNVGDSRVYRLLGNRMSQVTHDHSEVRELLEHNIREAAALPRMARAFSAPLPA